MAENIVNTQNRVVGGGNIVGFDLLKFVMAIFIVSIHTQAFCNVPSLGFYMFPIVRAAVPVFFVLSSYFFSLKLRKGNLENGMLAKYLSRIGLLYLFWAIVNLPFVVKHIMAYRADGFGFMIIETIRDILFSYTYSGSWFLSAMMLSIIVLFYICKYKFPEWLMALLAMFSLVIVFKNEYLPFMDRFYDVIRTYIRPELDLTFFAGFPWVVLGYLLSGINTNKHEITHGKFLFSSIVFCIILYIISLCFPESILIRILFVMTIVITFYAIPDNKILPYKLLRNVSILIFFIHFDVLFILKKLTGATLGEGILSWCLVSVTSVVLACLTLKIESKVKILKYSH